MGLHIYDIDRETWLLNTDAHGHEYNSIATKIRQQLYLDSEDEDSHQDSDQEELYD